MLGETSAQNFEADVLVQVQLHPHHLPLLAHLAACLDESSESATAAAAAKEAALQAKAAAGQAPMARSIIEGVLLPDTTAFATEFMTRSWAYGHASTSENAEEVSLLYYQTLHNQCIAEPERGHSCQTLGPFKCENGQSDIVSHAGARHG